MGRNINKRIGEKFLTNEGYKIEIIDYLNKENCTIKFDNGLVVSNLIYCNIKKGQIKNPMHKSICNIGFIGIGKYNRVDYIHIYNCWVNMIKRCYDEKIQIKRHTYIGCSVHKDWHNYQKFAKWFEKNNPHEYELDKDILFKGNKIYSANNCCFVPSKLNTLLKNKNRKKGNNIIGVTYHKRDNHFRSQIVIDNKLINSGGFKTEQEAFNKSKEIKEIYIKKLANKYKDTITIDCYNALVNLTIDEDY